MTDERIINNEYIEAIRDIYEIVKGDYETLDPQAKKDIENIITNIAKSKLWTS